MYSSVLWPFQYCNTTMYIYPSHTEMSLLYIVFSNTNTECNPIHRVRLLCNASVVFIAQGLRATHFNGSSMHCWLEDYNVVLHVNKQAIYAKAVGFNCAWADNFTSSPPAHVNRKGLELRLSFSNVRWWNQGKQCKSWKRRNLLSIHVHVRM